jgi:hypothetical protein
MEHTKPSLAFRYGGVSALLPFILNFVIKAGFVILKLFSLGTEKINLAGLSETLLENFTSPEMSYSMNLCQAVSPHLIQGC